MTIDWWTLGIQAVNVLILVWLLGRFFWRPLAAMIEGRRAAAAKSLAEAEAKRAAATAALAEIGQTRAGFAKERDAILAAAHQAADQAHAARLERAETEAAALEAAAKDAIEKERLAAEQAWSDRAAHLAIDIAQRLAARLDGPAVRAAFLDWLLREIGALPEAARQAVAANGTMLEAITATPLDPADQQRYRGLIGTAFGGHPEITFKDNPALIAGLELHGPQLVVSNSWRADLTRILTDVTHDAGR
jgi:F-type H+-transporting ATPase subunit b